MTRRIDVDGCLYGCPFDSDENATCEHPDAAWRSEEARSTMPARVEHAGEHWAPGWCPLRKGWTLVILRTKESA